jgi:hypothetical protein
MHDNVSLPKQFKNLQQQARERNLGRNSFQILGSGGIVDYRR